MMDSTVQANRGSSMLASPTIEGSPTKKTKKQSGKKPAPMELHIYNDPTVLAYGNWEEAPEPWTSAFAMKFISFPHVDRWYPKGQHQKHCRARGYTYSRIIDTAVKWRFLEVLRAISHRERWEKNAVPARIATMIYAELVLKKVVDWSTLADRSSSNAVFGKIGDHYTVWRPKQIPRTSVPEWFLSNTKLLQGPNNPPPLTTSTIIDDDFNDESMAEVMPSQDVFATPAVAFKIPISPSQEGGEDDDCIDGPTDCFHALDDVIVDAIATVDLAENLSKDNQSQDRNDDINISLKTLELEVQNLQIQKIEGEERHALTVASLQDKNANLLLEMAQLCLQLEDSRNIELSTRNKAADLHVEVQTMKTIISNKEALIDDLERRSSNGSAFEQVLLEMKKMTMVTLLSVAKSRQYEEELKSLRKEWTEYGRLRNLMITSWPLDETMYPSSWETTDSTVYLKSGGIDWASLPEDDHRWNIDEEDIITEKMLENGVSIQGKLWPTPHVFTKDGEGCAICQYPYGPEGWFTLGSCGHHFHPQCLIKRMIMFRTCPLCPTPFHTRLYMQFGLRDFMPTDWKYRHGDHIRFGLQRCHEGKPVEWYWRKNMSVAELYLAEGGDENLNDEDKVLEFAKLIWPNTPDDAPLKKFFYRVCQWHWDDKTQSLQDGIGPPPYYNSQGLLAVDKAFIKEQYLPLGGDFADKTASEEQVWEENFHRWELITQALLQRIEEATPELKNWLHGTRLPNHFHAGPRIHRHGYQTRSTVRASLNGASPIDAIVLD